MTKAPDENANEVQRMIYAASERAAWISERDPSPNPGFACAKRVGELLMDGFVSRTLRAAGMRSQ